MISFVDTTLRCPSAGDDYALDQGREDGGGRTLTKKTKFPASIGPMVQAIVPAAEAVASKPGDFVDNAIHESAVRTARKIATESPIIAELVKKGKVKVVAGRYDLEDGRVEFFA